VKIWKNVMNKDKYENFHEWGRRGMLIDYWWGSQRERDH
jgi:hypothetical protein